MNTEKLERNILGKMTEAHINNKKTKGKILAIADYSTHQQVCFQTEEGRMGVWIPVSDMNLETLKLEKQEKILKSEKEQEKILKSEKEQEKILKSQEEQEEILKSQEEQEEIFESEEEQEPSLQERSNFKETYLREIEKEVNKSPILVDLKGQSNQKAWSQLIDVVAESACNVQFLASQKSVNRLITSSVQRNLSRDEIAHRLIFHKSLQAAGFEFFSDIIEAFNRIFQNIVNIPLPSLAKLSAEMIYQIAIIYGFDPESPEAKLEALNIFALTSMGEQALNIGLDWLKFDPALNKAVKVTGKAAMIYGIGHAACLFYKYKSETGRNLLDDTKWLKEDFLPQTQEYLEIATSEEKMKESLIQEFQPYYKPIDYQKIEKYLSEKNWKSADAETGKVILDILTRYMTKNVQNIPDKDLQKINTIWTKASKGKFGFKVQKQIYKTKTGFLKMNPVGNFGQEVGWRGEAGIFGGVFAWKKYDDLTFDLKSAPKGHLPAFWFDIYNDHHGFIVKQYLIPILQKNIEEDV